MPNEEPAQRTRARLGLWLGVIYLALATSLFVATALTTKPDNVGLDWIPFYLLAMPWSGMARILAIPGVFLNALVLWLLGTLLQKLLRAIRR